MSIPPWRTLPERTARGSESPHPNCCPLVAAVTLSFARGGWKSPARRVLGFSVSRPPVASSRAQEGPDGRTVRPGREGPPRGTRNAISGWPGSRAGSPQRRSSRSTSSWSRSDGPAQRRQGATRTAPIGHPSARSSLLRWRDPTLPFHPVTPVRAGRIRPAICPWPGGWFSAELTVEHNTFFLRPACTAAGCCVGRSGPGWRPSR